MQSRSRLSGERGLYNTTPDVVVFSNWKIEETAGHRRARDRPGSRNVPLYSFPRITYLTSLGRERTMETFTNPPISVPPRFFFRSVDGFPPVWTMPVLSLYPGPLLVLTPTSHPSPVPLVRLFNFRLNFLPARLSAAERERLSAVDERLRLVASSQTRIKRAIDVGKSPGNLPARPLSWITLAGSVLCTSWLIERGDCIRACILIGEISSNYL